jgi:hypothetical protein
MVHWIRHEKVILDFHLAGLYEVETRALKQAVRRNRDRFPGDFLFELTDAEMDALVSQSVIPSRKKFGGAGQASPAGPAGRRAPIHYFFLGETGPARQHSRFQLKIVTDA